MPNYLHLAVRPLICFGSILIAGVAGFVLTSNGFSFLAFLLFYVPVSLLIMILGIFYARTALALLPPKHWGRPLLIILAVMAAVALALAGAVIFGVNSHSAGGF